MTVEQMAMELLGLSSKERALLAAASYYEDCSEALGLRFGKEDE